MSDRLIGNIFVALIAIGTIGALWRIALDIWRGPAEPVWPPADPRAARAAARSEWLAIGALLALAALGAFFCL